MAQHVTDLSSHKKNRGFTLVEMLIALMIISVGVMAMMSMSLTVVRTNYENDVRNAAVRVASDMAEEIYAMPFDSVVTGGGTRTVKLRGFGDKVFNLNWTVVNQTNDLKQVTLNVVYTKTTGTGGGSGLSQTNTTVIYRHRAT